MNFEQIKIAAEIAAALATVAAFLVVAYEIRKSRQTENRAQILETRKMFQDLYEFRKRASAMTWKDYADYNKKYPATSNEYWASQIVLEFFDMIGDSVKNKELERLPMLRLWGTKATYYWSKFGEVITMRNAELDIDAFEDLKWLAEETQIIYPDLKPEVPFQGNIPIRKKK